MHPNDDIFKMKCKNKKDYFSLKQKNNRRTGYTPNHDIKSMMSIQKKSLRGRPQNKNRQILGGSQKHKLHHQGVISPIQANLKISSVLDN